MDIIDRALSQSRTTLTEYESKQVLAEYGIPVTAEVLVEHRDALADACARIGFPLVMKGSSAEIAHKTEKSLVRLDIRTEEEAFSAFHEITAAMNSDDAAVLVQELVNDPRELMAGLVRDPQFGPCVMFGLGGIFSEILKDVAFRMAPLRNNDAVSMINDIQSRKILDGVRGLEPVDSNALSHILGALGRIGLEIDPIKEIDVNPLKIRDGRPIAVDALIVLGSE